MKRLTVTTVLCALALLACDVPRNYTADEQAAQETAQMAAEAQRRTGMPNIVNFTEKRFVKQLMELRDGEIVTYSYIVDLNGRLHFLCPSIGYGIPASVQFTNPAYIADEWSQGGFAILPQAEANGLFMPEGLSATYVMCADPNGGDARPVYVEPEILVSPFKLDAVDNYGAGS